MHTRFYFLFFMLCYGLSGQEFYGLKDPGAQLRNHCERCLHAFEIKPKEVQFRVERDIKNNLYFVVGERSWFYELFGHAYDGIAIDIIPRSQYNCDVDLPKGNRRFRGILQKPIYAKKLVPNLKQISATEFMVPIGKVPNELQNQDLEFNIVFINDNYICQYYGLYDLKSYPLELLDMGMYLDTIVYRKEFREKLIDKDTYVVKYKKLDFKIPFEQNKAVYYKEDIRPLYDSLRLTDFTIKRIDIKAYSSVEGTLERNIELQEQRAKSILQVMQKYQKDTIKTSVNASENWVEFLNDIKGTDYAYLDTLSKIQIKHKLNAQGLGRKLEPILKNHRKALLSMELQRKDAYTIYGAEKLLELYDQAIKSKNALEAENIQNALFQKLKAEQISPEQLLGLKVPSGSAYAPLRNNKAGHKYLINERDAYIAFLEIEKLILLAPNDKRVLYNYCALKFLVWRYGAANVNPAIFYKEIRGLKEYGIPQILIDRMLINYHIIKSEILMQKGDYHHKDQSVKFIYNNYKNLKLDDNEALNLAQYFTYYGNTKYTLEVLEDKVKKIEVSEDLLFYYLNHTLVKKNLTKRSDYRTIMLNAISFNKERYCKLFDTHGKGGVTFQLLEDPYLKKTYCESCQEAPAPTSAD